MIEKKEIDFRDLLEDSDDQVYEQEWDEYDDLEDDSFEEEHRWDGLDPAFSSWQDYYNYMYG